MLRRHTPGPHGKQLRASLSRIQRDALTEYLALHDHYGDVVRLAMFPHSLYLVRHPDAIQHILRDQAQRYRKGDRFQAIVAVQGQGLLTSEGNFWRQQRRLMQPVFRQRHVNVFDEAVIDEAQSLVYSWRPLAQSGEAVNVTAWLHRLAFRVVGQTLLGLPPADLDPIARQIESIAAPLMRHLASGRMRHSYVPAWLRASLPGSLQSSQTRRFRHALRAYHDIAQHIVDMRRRTMSSNPAADTDLLARLIRTHDQEAALTSLQLRDEIITFIGAGVETSATTLSWACYLLAQHPEVTQRLQVEIDKHLADRMPQPDDLAELCYSRMILEETLRLYPPSAVLPRQANTVDYIAVDRTRYETVPKHAVVLMSQYVTHRHPDFWTDPERFDPERFAPERIAKQHQFAYFPFGAGPRVCIGKPLAWLEMHLTLVTIAQAYELRLMPERSVQPALGATLHPRGGLWMTVHERG